MPEEFKKLLLKPTVEYDGCTSHWSTYFVARSNYVHLLISSGETQSNRQRSHLSDKSSTQDTGAAAFLENTAKRQNSFLCMCAMYMHYTLWNKKCQCWEYIPMIKNNYLLPSFAWESANLHLKSCHNYELLDFHKLRNLRF